MKSIQNDVILALQWACAGMGAVAYFSSCFGRRSEDVGVFLGIAFVTLFVASIPTAIRDRRFFLKYWGFGLMEVRRSFPLQWFPARSEDWLNPMGWALFALLLLHFLLITLAGLSPRPDGASEAGLRFCYLMVTVGGVLGAVRQMYPPTMRPEDHAT